MIVIINISLDHLWQAYIIPYLPLVPLVPAVQQDPDHNTNESFQVCWLQLTVVSESFKNFQTVSQTFPLPSIVWHKTVCPIPNSNHWLLSLLLYLHFWWQRFLRKSAYKCFPRNVRKYLNKKNPLHLNKIMAVASYSIKTGCIILLATIAIKFTT